MARVDCNRGDQHLDDGPARNFGRMSDERPPVRPHPGEHGPGPDSGSAARRGGRRRRKPARCRPTPPSRQRPPLRRTPALAAEGRHELPRAGRAEDATAPPPDATKSHQPSTPASRRLAQRPRRSAWPRSIPPTAARGREEFATCSPPRPTRFSPARKSAPRSRRSTRTAISRRCGSTRAWRMRAPRRSIARLKGADADGLEARRLQDAGFRRARARTRWPRPTSGSPRPCSPTRAICRPAASPIAASAKTISSWRSSRPIPPKCSPRSPTQRTPARRSTITARRTRPTRRSRRSWPSCAARTRRGRDRSSAFPSGPMLQGPAMDDPRVPAAARAPRASTGDGEHRPTTTTARSSKR